MRPVPQELIDKMVNSRFGRLVVNGLDGRNTHEQIIWKCKCDCGKDTYSTTFILTSGNKKSCGCLRRELSKSNNTTHGLSDHRLYDIWCGMRSRCFNPNDNNYPHYGGKGVTICNEWNDFQAFYNWSIVNGYDEHLTIDRYPNQNGNYEPTNCRWTTMAEQARNRSITKLNEDMVREIKNDPRTSIEIARNYNVSKDTINKIRSGKVWEDVN